MNDVQFKAKYSQAELLELTKQIESDPASKETVPGSIYLYNKKARKELDDIARAITLHMAERRAAEGRPVPCDGYSGRQTNRR